MKTEKEKKKEKRTKERSKKKEELKHLNAMFKYDEDGNKRTKAQINDLIMKNLSGEFKQEVETVERKSKYLYAKEVFTDENGMTHIIEKDF